MDVAVSSFGKAYRHTAAQRLDQAVKLQGTSTVGGVEVTFETVVPAGRDTEAEAVAVTVPAPPAADVFASRLRDLVNASATSLGIATGMRLGLFDAMASVEGSCSVAELALKTRLEDRYIEEWMNLMVAGGIIHVRAAPSSGHSDTSASGAGAGAGAGVGVGAGTSAGAGARLADPGTAPSQLHVQRFTLPEGAKALLTTSSAGSASPLAVRCLQMQALAAEGFKHMPECFAQGGGVPSIMFPGCNSVAGDLSAATPVVALVDQVPGLGEALHTAGSDAAPRILIGDDPTGRVACAFGAAFPKAIVAGWGASPEDVAAGEKAVAAAGLTNVLYSASSVDWGVEEGAGTFTHIVLVQGLGKSNDPTYALENMFTLLKPNGTASVLQLAAGASVGDTVALQPVAAAEYAASLFHALPQSRSGDAAGVGLLWSNADVQECMSDAGFSVSQRSCSWDPRLVHFVCGKPPATVGVAE